MNRIFTAFLAFIASITSGICDENKGDKAMENNKILVVYFSRPGDQYSVGTVNKGNTAIIAEMLAEELGADTFEIKVKTDNYPKEYDAMTEYAKKEMNTNARPEIVGDIENFSEYSTVFVGYPIWWGDMPMPVYTFLEKYDFSGKTVIPFCTHEGSALGDTEDHVKKATKAKVLDGLAIYGHDAQNNQDASKEKVKQWLKKLGYSGK